MEKSRAKCARDLDQIDNSDARNISALMLKWQTETMIQYECARGPNHVTLRELAPLEKNGRRSKGRKNLASCFVTGTL